MEAIAQSSFERFTKVSIGADATMKLRTLQIRTRLTPNVLSRFAIMLSLAESGTPNEGSSASDGMEFNSYTLFGQYESLICALVTERCLNDGAAGEVQLQDEVRAHINRGVVIMYPRVKSLANLTDLLPVKAAEGHIE